MAIAMAVGDLLACRMWSQLDDQAAVNTYNVEVISNTGAGATDLQLAQYWDATYSNFYKAFMPSTADYHGVQVYYLNRGTGVFLPAPVSSTAGAGAGIGTGSALPSNTAAILKYNTSIRGPGGRGRVFLPFIATSFITTAGIPTNAFSVLVNSTVSAMLVPQVIGGGGNTSTVVWVLARKTTGGLPVSNHQITNAQSAQKFGQMHKRGDYGRPNASPI